MVINLKDYICKGDHGASAAVARAITAMGDGDVLALGGTRLDFYRDGTTRRHFCISNNDSGDKDIVFPIFGKNGIIIDGEGADLIFHGEILPFAIHKSSNITVRNLSIDYADPMYVQATITEVTNDSMVLQFDGDQFRYRERNGKIWIYSQDGEWEHEFRHCLVMEVDRETKGPSAYVKNYITETTIGIDHGFLGRMFKPMQFRDLGNNRLRVYGDICQTHHSGNDWVATFHYNRKNPGIFIDQSDNIRLEKINLYHTLAMGVIGQISENICLDNVNTVPRKNSGRFLSVCADATHFVNCRGIIQVENCTFTNMLDDGLNIHGIYTKVLRTELNNRIFCGFGHRQQQGIQIYKPGDRIRIVEMENAQTVGVFTVKDAELLTNEEVWIETSEYLPCFDDRYVVENLSATPKVEIRDCKCGNNRPRGFLISTPQAALIENCTFYNMFSGIMIGPEMNNWFESGQVCDITIRGNHFANSAFAGASPAINIAPRVKNPDTLRAYHSGIVIEDNTFVMAEKRFLKALAVDGIVFRNNKFIQDKNLPSHGVIGEEGVSFINCDNVTYEPVECLLASANAYETLVKS